MKVKFISNNLINNSFSLIIIVIIFILIIILVFDYLKILFSTDL